MADACLHVVAFEIGTQIAAEVMRGDGLADGIYHLAPRGAVTWCGFARHVVEVARGLGMPLVLEPQRVRPIPTSAYPTPAARPPYSLLDCSASRELLGLEPTHWQAALAQVLGQLADLRAIPGPRA
jgi:dTDP-4-dehydrorhamnose reductase